MPSDRECLLELVDPRDVPLWSGASAIVWWL